jgi:hypothetical protein
VIIDPIQVGLRVAEALEACGVRYAVGGSIASAISGEPRSTLDVDIVVALTEVHVDRFVELLGDEFHADPIALRAAIRERSSTNLIHIGSSTKVDLFISGSSPLDDLQIERRMRVRVASDPDRYLYVCTAEDILLQKLRWFRMGNEISDRQWRDILGIVLVQSESLDSAYLLTGARRLGVVDLLERARSEAGA